jgi:RNA polymerase-binding transcription factor DksA
MLIPPISGETKSIRFQEPGEELMAASKLAMRRVILSNLFEYLKLNYDFERPADTFVNGQISDRDIDILLSYKSDHRLGELREALARVESGTYGYCIGCKRALSRADLERDPAVRVCPACEQSFNMRHQPVHSPLFSENPR